ncbi:MAG TPA: UDP-3-O-acyl-N-acetylglucosamine deacetylase [Geminicoccaceae bacterium]|nr:UDP-3-O-acyl-N-acetylglucosamine deacetylase [Geminicoccaceae bacterium]
MRQQRTLRHVIGCAGVGLHSGARVGLTLRPAAEGFGVRFRRVDRPGAPAIPASIEHVAAAADSVTSLGDRPADGVRMIEHLMAAFVACEIDNVLVESSGPELPAMDGSALPFVLLIECAGTVEQDRPAMRLEVLRPVSVSSAGAQARLEPGPGLELDVEAAAPVCPPARFRFRFSPEACKSELVAAREAACRAASKDPGDDRFADESIRHAALDALGDLALMPARLEGRYAERGNDPTLRRRLLRRLLDDRRAWRLRHGSTVEPSTFPRGIAGRQLHAA